MAACCVALAVPWTQSRATATALDIEEYVVDGNTVLAQEDVEAAVYPYLGPGKSAADVEAARVALQKLYRAKGYLTVQVSLGNTVPTDGTVHLTVAEVRVGRLRVVGSRFYSLAEIKSEAPALKEGSVPNFNALKRDEIGLNALMPDRTITPTIKAGHTPGTIDADLLVKDRPPLHASVEINNQNSIATSKLRTIASVSYDNLWQLGHRLSLSFQTAPESPKDAKVFSAAYLARFLGTPYSVTLTAIKSDSNVAAVAGTNVIGNGTILGARGMMELPGSERLSHSAQLEVDYKDFRNDTRASQDAAGNSLVPVTYFPVTASYSIDYSERHASDLASLALTLAPARAGSSQSVIYLNRANARGQDLYLRTMLDRTQELPEGFAVHSHLDAQVTDQPLISNEQFPIGGVRSVRGYYESEKLVDTGVSGTVELVSPSLPDLWQALAHDAGLQSLHILGFADGGRGFLFKPLAEQQSSFALASAGVGLDLRFLNHLTSRVYWARPLLATENTPAGTQMVLFTVSSEY